MAVSNAPIFVLCYARSGSTLLRYILDTHPEIVAPPELHLLTAARQLAWVFQHTAQVPSAEGSEADSGRKISVTVQLSAGDDYEGGELELNSGKILSAMREAGAIVLFPSFMLHRVAPVTRGQRWAIVGWVQGQDQFR